MTAPTQILARFARADEGNNVVEYALVIGLMSVVLVILLSSVVGGGLQANIATLITRIAACLAPNATTC
jgi:pilus assembly protein Flp/PilA